MSQSAERILVTGHMSPVGAAVVRQLIRLGHPRSHILALPTSDLMWASKELFQKFLESERPGQVYWIDAPSSCLLTPNSAIEAASQAGMARFMYVALSPFSAPVVQQHKDGRGTLSHELDEYQRKCATEALVRCEALRACGQDYRCVMTCEPYGPFWPGQAPARMTQAAGMIERFLHQFADAIACGTALVTIDANPGDRLELMFINDIAEAVVHVMDLPCSEFAFGIRSKSLYVEIGAESDLAVADLVKAVAAASGFRGRVAYETKAPSQPVHRLDNREMSILGWRPLIEVDTGIELTAMDFRLRHMARHTLGENQDQRSKPKSYTN